MDLGDILKTKKKEELINIINDYNKLVKIYAKEEIEINKKSKKEDLINKIINIKEEYIQMIVCSLDIEDFEILKSLLSNKISISNYESFCNYLNSKEVFIQECSFELIDNNKNILEEMIKSKEVNNYIKKWNRIYKVVEGIIVAYGVVDINYFKNIIKKLEDENKVLDKLEYYYKRSYTINDKMLVSNKLSNKKRIDKYYKDNKYKEFSIKDFESLGNNLYHHNIKAYKKFIKMLKNNYVFKKRDIEYVDKKIVIPYLYISLNEEEKAAKNLEKRILESFEFNKDRLKNNMLSEITKIRNEFPLWEYRGHTKMEENK